MRRTNVVKLVVAKDVHERLVELATHTAKCWNEVNWLRMRQFKEAGVRVGVVVAPIIPLDGWERELEELFQALAELKPDIIYGEILHMRGKNVQMLREAGVEPITGPKLDWAVGRRFEQLLAQYGLKGEYWFEYG